MKRQDKNRQTPDTALKYGYMNPVRHYNYTQFYIREQKECALVGVFSTWTLHKLHQTRVLAGFNDHINHSNSIGTK